MPRGARRRSGRTGEGGRGKLIEAGAWLADKPDCETCRALLAEYGEEPDCESCEPEILPENEDAWRVFMLTSDQHIMGFNGPVAVNLLAVFGAMDRLGIDDQAACASKVKTAYRGFLEAMKCHN